MGFWPGRVGGVETYFRNLVNNLQLIDRENHYIILCDEPNIIEFSLLNPKFEIKMCNYRKGSLKRLIRSALRRIRIDILRAEPRYLKFDVVHHPFSEMRPEWSRFPSVLTFWDMQQEFYPEFFHPGVLKRRRETYKLSTQTATRIIAGSKFTKDSLIEKFNVPADKIEVIYPGYGPEYKVSEDKTLLTSILNKYKLVRPFIFYPAATWPHKNHKKLLEALHLMINRYGFDGELVLTGAAMDAHKEVLEIIEKHDLTKSVRMLGFLQYEDLPYLYNLARMMVFPSLFEGFGIPLVEAMACGCPVLCANAASIPEVVGDAGLLFDPDSAEEIAEKTWNLWNNDAKRKEMIDLGLSHAKLFDWRKTAQMTLEVYKKTKEICL